MKLTSRAGQERVIFKKCRENFLKGNLYLIGFMGSGKTVIGKGLAGALGWGFLDTDEAITEAVGLSVKEIFELYGEAYFREQEASLVQELSGVKNLVVATGGGIVLREKNIRALKASGKIIWLKASPEAIFARLRDKDDRPLLPPGFSVSFIQGFLAGREPFYRRAADLKIETTGKSIAQVIRAILKKLKKEGGENGKNQELFRGCPPKGGGCGSPGCGETKGT